MVKAIIFDMDGLMFDTERLAKEAWQQVGEEMGLPITEEVICHIRGATPAASQAVFSTFFGEEFDYAKAKARRNELVEAEIARHGVPVKQGLVYLLKTCRQQNILCAVASSSPRATAVRYLAMAGIESFFSAVIGAEDVTRSKPAPDCFLAAARALGARPKDCLVLEDSANGLYAAKAAQIPSICIPDLTLPEKAALSSTQAVLERLDQVVDWLNKN